ncbi:amidase [Pimelobacter simplex]|uniref:amidase n=1 Tax=Nocardioides simplex TaxID=2045 RepID=UPI003AACF6F6
MSDVPLPGLREIGARLASGTTTAVALTEDVLARIERRNPALGAFTHVAAASARAQAAAADERQARGERLGPLDGVPVAVKDLVDVAGLPTEAGSPILAGHRAERDAPVVAALRRSGAVLLGKTATDEFALTAVGAATRNPLDEALLTGGSSGGSAAAVAAGLCFAAIGTDTGGSVRIPAACCGIAGLKPTQALLPTDGVFPLAPSLDHVGVLARTVDDLTLFLEALLPAAPAGIETAAATAPLLAVPGDLGDCAPEVREKFAAALDAAVARGARITERGLPDLDRLREAHWTLLAAEVAAVHRQRFGPDERRYGPALRDALDAGDRVTSDAYLHAQAVRGEVRRAVDAALAGADALVLPTLALDVPPAGTTTARVNGADGAAEVDLTAALVRLTSLFNHSGHPALSVPVPGAGPGGLPFGLQLVGRHFAEEELLAVARGFESALTPSRKDNT